MRRLMVVSLALAACSGAGSEPASTTTATTAASATTVAPPATWTPTTAVTDLEVVVFDSEVTDPTRDRRIPYRVYAPVGPTGDVPVLLVSHGGDGNERGFRTGGHLGTTFAEGGYLAIHVGHLPSRRASQHRIDRPADVSFLLDRLTDGTLPLPAEFTGTTDVSRVGHTGHSFGAYTSHALAGATFDRTFTDDRVDAIAPISPQGPDQFRAFDRGPDDNTWRTVSVPVYGLVGGDEVDSNAVDSIMRPGWRLVPFERYPGTVDTFLTIIEGQDHRDMWSTGGPEVEGFIATNIRRFFDVYVRGDPEADACLIGTGDQVDAITTRRAGTEASRLADCP